MLALFEHGRLSVKELGAVLQIDSGTLSPLLKRMESAGLLRRTRRADDERSVHVELTDQGQALTSRVRAVPRDVRRSLGAPADDLAALHGQLTALLDKLGAG